MKCFALQYNINDPFLLRSYDDQISIYDNADELKNKLERLNTEEVPSEEGENEDQQTLSSREKEIVICVVKGMTNREIGYTYPPTPLLPTAGTSPENCKYTVPAA